MNRYYKFLFLFTLLFSLPIYSEKVLVFTYSYNRPDFIEIQEKTFKKLLKDDYEFVVFNDARYPDMQEKIRNTCASLNVRCIDIPQYIHDMPYLKRFPGEGYHDASVRNSNVVMYSLNQLGFQHSGIVALFDSDLFLVKEFSIKEFMEGYDIASVHQSRQRNDTIIDYLWIGFAFLDMSKLPDKETINFNCGRIFDIPVDAGGSTYWYLNAHPDVKVRYVDEVSPFRYTDQIAPAFAPSCLACKQGKKKVCVHNAISLREKGFNEKQIKFIQSGPQNYVFLQNLSFLHYYAGSNWNNDSSEYHRDKTKRINDYIDDDLRD